MKKIIKRDGRKVTFHSGKIYDAIQNAFDACGKENTNEIVEKITDEVIEKLDSVFKHKVPHVENVQDTIEEVLIANNLSEVAKTFIIYRYNRTKIRTANSELMKTMKDITFKKAVDNDTKRENANIDGDSPMGTMLKYGSESAKAFYINQVIDPKFAEAHQSGDIHIHDMDFYTLTMTCCQIDLLELFKNGFSTGNGFLREPTSIRSYASLACIAIQANQNDQHGGQSVPNFDYSMAPGVKKSYKKNLRKELRNILNFAGNIISIDEVKELICEVETMGAECRMNSAEYKDNLIKNLTDKEFIGDISRIVTQAINNAYEQTKDDTYQAMEALIHNLNTMHSRAGAQVPFSSLNYGTDTSDEGRMVIDCLLRATEAGLGNGETPIFPIQIFKLKEGVSYNKEDKNYDLFRKACEVSGKRLFPNFSFLDAPYNLQYYKPGDYKTEVAYMGCRTRVIANVDKEHETTCGRGNLSFTSINLPRIGIQAKGDINKFLERLDELLVLCKDQLLERFEIQCKRHVYNFPFLMGQCVWLGSDQLSRNDEVRSVLKHGTLTIGFIGLAEALVALTGKHHAESPESQELGLKIVKHMRKRIDEFVKQYDLNFSLIATPAEGLSGRFTRIDKKKFGIIPGITNRAFYTNSFHVPVYYPISIFDKIKTEAPYNALTNGGHITYVEVDGDVAKNVDAFEKVIRCMHDNGIGYGSVNHPIDRDPVCGYNGIIDNICPKCGRHEDDVKFERIRRITGYLVGTLDRFNDGKRAEVESRVKHMRKEHCDCNH